MVLRKKVEEYSDAEVVRVFYMVKEYLKVSGEILELGGHRVKYMDYHVVCEREGELMGFEDELVYVGDSYSGDKKLGEVYMGMHEKEFTIPNMRGFLRQIDSKKLERIIVSVCASRALTECHKKDR